MVRKSNILQLILIISLFSYHSCVQKTNVTTIQVEVKNIETDTISYYLTKDGIGAYPLWQWNYVGLDSSMNAVIEIENPCLNSILIMPHSSDFRKSAFLLIQPGDYYSVLFDPSDSIQVKINGNYDDGQQFITDFYYFNTRFETEKEYIGQLYSDTIPESISENFILIKSPHIEKVESIYKNKGIDKRRCEAIRTLINYSYLDNMLSVLFRKSLLKEIDTLEYYNNAVAYPVNLMQNDFQKLLSDLFNEFPNNREYINLYFDLRQHLYYYIWYKSLNDSLSIHDRTEELQLAEKYLDPFLFELYFASQFTILSMKESFEAVEMRLETFKTRYPNSRYLPGIEYIMPFLKQRYYMYYPPEVSSDIQDLSEEIMLVEDYQEIKSLDQIIDRYKGKVIYIDFWASWCAPCIGEFEYAPQLHEFAEKNTIVLLYISTDKDELKWVNALNNSMLDGYHARMVTDEFRSELEKYGIYGIPRYMIVNKEGNIAVTEAKRPSSGNELFEQLLKYTN